MIGNLDMAGLMAKQSGNKGSLYAAAAAFASLVFILVLCAVQSSVGIISYRRHAEPRLILYPNADAKLSRQVGGPKYELIPRVGGTEVVWEKPSDGVPQGILFLAHGCSHGAIDFWDRSEFCPKCIGLPEEKRIVKAALRERYIVIAISSSDRYGSRCWQTAVDDTNQDAQAVARVLSTLQQRENWQHLPVHALGASSGGAFVSVLPHKVKLASVVVQIMMAIPDAIETPLPDGSEYPPTLFIHMERDVRTAKWVQLGMADLGRKRVAARQIAVKPSRVTPSFLSDRIEDVSPPLPPSAPASPPFSARDFHSVPQPAGPVNGSYEGLETPFELHADLGPPFVVWKAKPVGSLPESETTIRGM
ncbi:hypothetical protein CYMTET_18173 [Cymbomonas tetramitiformis]|uniref:Uncharacterized protein n=1 Tax=Cymbomonas tetramitiformis TaxID=36881 RepID=A0AAE0G8H5_9CHLO|nr:hypothetical protein CYMTET_18173 [Cymbomonas tetramitiformis]